MELDYLHQELKVRVALQVSKNVIYILGHQENFKRMSKLNVDIPQCTASLLQNENLIIAQEKSTISCFIFKLNFLQNAN